MEDWERDDLVANFVELIGQAARPVQERMLWHFYLVEDDFGRRVGDGLGITLEEVKDLPPLQSQTATRTSWSARAISVTTVPAMWQVCR